ncbi:MAG: alpha/beta hydrolase [Polyangiales bacterium]
MNARSKNNVRRLGRGGTSLLFAHGYGCDQNVWRFLTPYFIDRYQLVLFDLTGAGQSDLTAYDREKYSTLKGHAADVLEIAAEHVQGPCVFVGHSVSAMIGVLAALAKPEQFSSLVMICPSPCYIDDGDYIGGFTRRDIEGLLDTLDSNYLGWSTSMAPAIMGAPQQPELGRELTNSFCATDPEIAKHFARVTFLSDNRPELKRLTTRSLILQCSDDIIAPLAVGHYMEQTIPNASLRVIDNIGHCPHMSAPRAVAGAMNDFL